MNRQGSIFLASAVLDLFPQALLVSIDSTEKLFFVDVVFPFEFEKTHLSLLQERARSLVKGGEKIESMEMMPKNAAGLFQQQEQWILADRLKASCKSTVFVQKVLGRAVAFGEALQERVLEADIRIFSFQSVTVQGQRAVRLFGVMGENLKLKVKELSGLCSHEVLAEKQGLASFILPEGEWVFRPEGAKLRQVLMGWWQKRMRDFSVEPIAFMGRDLVGEASWVQRFLSYLSLGQEGRIGAVGPGLCSVERGVQEGFLADDVGTLDLAAVAASEENFLAELNSCLQFILEIPKIFSFEFEVVVSLSLEAPKSLRSWAQRACEDALKGVGQAWSVERGHHPAYLARVELRVRDSLGRGWASSFVGLPRKELEGSKVIFFSLFYSVERMLALLLENGQGKIDFDL